MMNPRTLTAEEFDRMESELAPAEPVSQRPGASRKPSARRRVAWMALAACCVVGAGGFAYLRFAGKFEETDNAFVEADVHPVSSRISGDVVEVLVDDNESVEKGQALAQLDPRDFEVKLKSAQAALDVAAAQVPQSEAALAAARAAQEQSGARIQAGEAQVEKARLDLERAERLCRVSNRAISVQDLDHAKAAFDTAKGDLEAARAARDGAAAGVAEAEARRNSAIAGHEHARTVVEDASLQLSYTTIRSPESGRIAKKTLQTGQHVLPGQALMAVVSPERWIIANFKENQLRGMRAGQSARISIDALGGRYFTGRIDSFAPGTGAKFTLLPPDNATGNFTKIVQRVPVKVRLNAEGERAFENQIGAGLSATVCVQLKD